MTFKFFLENQGNEISSNLYILFTKEDINAQRFPRALVKHFFL